MQPDPIFSINPWVLVVSSIVFFAGAAVLTRLLAHRYVPDEDKPKVLAIVGPLTPALAALFAVMVAFTVVNEAGYLRVAQSAASSEATASSRLAWAATNPGVDTVAVQDALADYIEVMVGPEWTKTFEDEPILGPVERGLRRLETVTRDQATRPGLPASVSSELLAGLDGVTMARRDRIAEASRGIPMSYLLVLVITGLALVVNVALLTLWGGHASLVLVGGVALVVALALALLIGISAPFAGPLVVDHAALDRVLIDLQHGVFRPLG